MERLADGLAALKQYKEMAGVATCTRATGYVTVSETQAPETAHRMAA